MRDSTPHPRAGQVYEFNKVRAKVIGFTDDDVSWQEDGKKAVHQTPRWYFEQHAVAPANGNRGSVA